MVAYHYHLASYISLRRSQMIWEAETTIHFWTSTTKQCWHCISRPPSQHVAPHRSSIFSCFLSFFPCIQFWTVYSLWGKFAKFLQSMVAWCRFSKLLLGEHIATQHVMTKFSVVFHLFYFIYFSIMAPHLTWVRRRLLRESEISC